MAFPSKAISVARSRAATGVSPGAWRRDIDQLMRAVGLQSHSQQETSILSHCMWANYPRKFGCWAFGRLEMIEQRDLRIRMRDGIHLALDVYRPDGKGPFPVLYAAALHNKDMQGPDMADVLDRKSTRLNSSHRSLSRMPSSA